MANQSEDLSLHSKSNCFGCQNRVADAPLSPAQCHPASIVFDANHDGPIVTNSDGVIGSAFVEITESSIDIGKLTSTYASCDECGAIATFIGVTRNHFHGRPVARLEYEAYTSMAMKQMSHIVRSVFSQYSQVHRVVISHRIGAVPVREASVFIAVTTEHRESGLAAVAFAINTLKEKVPVWKREFYTTGEAITHDGDEESVWKRNSEFSSPKATHS
ncbi:molybdenum cofactor synthesis protein 2 large subunit, putative [Bodo saltans]|uniref:Molybdenum cofactor synthesis protein 2 large subunit, putative n=1 Tax=Bodo saltans TaxID=75058 RepID=A0A0S4JUE0_BODSA|nr:molybdenum cofactor synthesis protein 2 large subunit, putative [Bodo saltans]|eukprot:CUG93832.1 molybdenum cofactor synthesis protein 2 large subunit, putative [Bodo saltans]